MHNKTLKMGESISEREAHRVLQQKEKPVEFREPYRRQEIEADQDLLGGFPFFQFLDPICEADTNMKHFF